MSDGTSDAIDDLYEKAAARYGHLSDKQIGEEGRQLSAAIKEASVRLCAAKDELRVLRHQQSMLVAVWMQRRLG